MSEEKTPSLKFQKQKKTSGRRILKVRKPNPQKNLSFKKSSHELIRNQNQHAFDLTKEQMGGAYNREVQDIHNTVDSFSCNRRHTPQYTQHVYTTPGSKTG